LLLGLFPFFPTFFSWKTRLRYIFFSNVCI
jgi:hypothetical protein